MTQAELKTFILESAIYHTLREELSEMVTVYVSKAHEAGMMHLVNPMHCVPMCVSQLLSMTFTDSGLCRCHQMPKRCDRHQEYFIHAVYVAYHRAKSNSLMPFLKTQDFFLCEIEDMMSDILEDEENDMYRSITSDLQKFAVDEINKFVHE